MIILERSDKHVMILERKVKQSVGLMIY